MDYKDISKLYAPYGKIVAKVMHQLYLYDERTLSQLLVNTKISHSDLSLALALMVQTRNVKCKKVKGRVLYSKVEPKLPYFPVYKAYIAEISNMEISNLFCKILVNGVVHSTKVKNHDAINFLRLQKIILQLSNKEIKLMYGLDTESDKKVREENGDKNYIIINYKELETKILIRQFSRCLQIKYDNDIAIIFNSVAETKKIDESSILSAVKSHITRQGLESYYEYLEDEGVLKKSNTSTNYSYVSEWISKFKRKVFLDKLDRSLRRVFVLLEEGVTDANLLNKVLMVRESAKSAVDLLLNRGFLTVFGEFGANVYFSKANVKLKSNFKFAISYYINQLAKDIIHGKMDNFDAVLTLLVLNYDEAK